MRLMIASRKSAAGVGGGRLLAASSFFRLFYIILSTRPKFKGGEAIFCAFPSSFS